MTEEGKVLIDPDIESPGVSRTMIRSSMSFGFSLIAHLLLLLLLTLFWITAGGSDIISLSVDSSASDVPDQDIMLAPIQVNVTSDLLESRPELLENELSELEIGEIADVSTTLMEESGGLDEDLGLTPIPGLTGGFFGLEAKGNKIVYIIDASPSMAGGYPTSRYRRAVEEVKKSVAQLKPDQKFFVFLFSYKTRPMNIVGEHNYCSPTPENQEALADWLSSQMLLPGTDPREAIVEALQMKPTCCFLLSDGAFNGRKVRNPPFGGGRDAPRAEALAKKYNSKKCPIHTIGLEDRANQKALSTIARQSKGQYKFIPAKQ